MNLKKELTCHLCGKATSIYELKAYPDGKWICINCADKIYNRRIKKEEYKIRESKINKNFDPYAMDLIDNNVSFIKTKSQEDKIMVEEKKVSNDSAVKEKSNTLRERKLYKCTYCKFESGQYNEEATCPNCGRSGRLVRTLNTSEIVDDIKKEPFYG